MPTSVSLGSCRACTCSSRHTPRVGGSNCLAFITHQKQGVRPPSSHHFSKLGGYRLWRGFALKNPKSDQANEEFVGTGCVTISFLDLICYSTVCILWSLKRRLNVAIAHLISIVNIFYTTARLRLRNIQVRITYSVALFTVKSKLTSGLS